MAEEHGHQRSGKKCKEKFENLYKYYKKTKEGKAGRQGGKHYRFFRQLEAIYGEASNSTINHLPYNQNQEVVSFTNSSEFETSSSENNDDHHHHHDLSAIALMMNKGIKKKSWKGKVEEFVDSQMRKIIDTQEAWMERMLRTIENREQERVFKEEEWRRQEAARFDQEVHELWAKERAWVEARDAALMEALKKFVGKGLENDNKRWSELEISSLISLRTSLELRFQEGGYLEEGLWEEIAAKMASLGHDRSALDYKEKWENISIYYGQGIPKQRLMVEGLLPSSSFNYSLNEGENVWENYGVKLNKGKNQQV